MIRIINSHAKYSLKCFLMTAPSFVKRVVNTCLRLNKEDRVTIFAWRHMLDLAQAFAIECKRIGAHVHTEFESDEMFYDAALNVPKDYLEKANPFDLALAGVATANIYISGPENPERLKDVPPETWVALSRGERPFYERLIERKVRMVEIGVGYVTPQRARNYGFDYDAWKKNVSDAIDVSYEDMQKLGKKFKTFLEGSRQVQITAPNGTNLNFALKGRKAHLHDGIIDEEDIEIGALFANLPGGTIVVAPDEKSANGILKSSTPFPQAGVLIHDITLSFENGKLVSFDGGLNINVLKSMWKEATGDKDRLGLFTLGLNPKAKLGFVHEALVLGTATIGIGLNKEFGGDNESDFGLPVTVANPTVKLDGKAIIKQGKLAL